MGGQRHPPAALPPERPGTHCIGGWVDPRAGLDGCGKLSPTGIRSPDRPVRSEWLYRLSYLDRHELAYVMIPVPHLYELSPDGSVVYSEINPTRCNNCVYSSQWLYSTCFGWQFHPSSGVHMLYMASGRQVNLCCNFVSIIVVLSL